MNRVTSSKLPVVTFPSPRGWRWAQVQELWRFRELLYFLVWRDVKVRYKQMALGLAWVVIQPLATVLVFTVIFGKFANVPSGTVPYAVFALAGLVPWTFFASGLTRGTVSLVGNANLITKVYFPRAIVPLSAILAGFVDVATTMAVLLAVMAGYGIAPAPTALLVPGFFVLAALATLGLSLWLSALNVRYRDVTQAIPFLTQIGLFVTPIVYPASLVPERWRVYHALNPMVGVVEGVRWALFGGGPPPLRALAISGCVTIVLLVTGFLFFRRAERHFADVV